MLAIIENYLYNLVTIIVKTNIIPLPIITIEKLIGNLKQKINL